MSVDPGKTDERRPAASHSPWSSRLVVGLIIILLGVLLLADNLDLLNAKRVLHVLWPLGLTAIGLAMVRDAERERRRVWGWVLIVLGAWIFFDHIGWMDLSLWELLLPGLFLFVGGSLVRRSLLNPDARTPGDEHAEFTRSFAFLSVCELRPVSRPFRGADVGAVMGGVKLDLTDAHLEGDSAVVDVFAFWGGVELHVPPDWTVASKVTTLLGGFIDKRRPTSVLPAKTLNLRGTIVMSGIEVKN